MKPYIHLQNKTPQSKLPSFNHNTFLRKSVKVFSSNKPSDSNLTSISTSSDISHLLSCPIKAYVRKATEPSELRAAAYLRSLCFSDTFKTFKVQNPLLRLHNRNIADLEWESLSKKVSGHHPLYNKAHTVTCYTVAVENEEGNLATASMAKELDPSTRLPSGFITESPDSVLINNSSLAKMNLKKSANINLVRTSISAPALVVATLDLNIGPTLPEETLVGRLPRGQRQHKRRAYVSNLCVCPSARRRGLAAALMERAEHDAKAKGVHYLYVHVELGNSVAREFYERIEFRIEKVEKASSAALRSSGSSCKALLVKPLYIGKKPQ